MQGTGSARRGRRGDGCRPRLFAHRVAVQHWAGPAATPEGAGQAPSPDRVPGRAGCPVRHRARFGLLAVHAPAGGGLRAGRDLSAVGAHRRPGDRGTDRTCRRGPGDPYPLRTDVLTPKRHGHRQRDRHPVRGADHLRAPHELRDQPSRTGPGDLHPHRSGGTGMGDPQPGGDGEPVRLRRGRKAHRPDAPTGAADLRPGPPRLLRRPAARRGGLRGHLRQVREILGRRLRVAADTRGLHDRPRGAQRRRLPRPVAGLGTGVARQLRLRPRGGTRRRDDRGAAGTTRGPGTRTLHLAGAGAARGPRDRPDPQPPQEDPHLLRARPRLRPPRSGLAPGTGNGRRDRLPRGAGKGTNRPHGGAGGLR